MKYDEYRANGWFIGSGVIESGCKTVIGQRFKQSGMIWSLKGAKALLPLRTLYKSDRTLLLLCFGRAHHPDAPRPGGPTFVSARPCRCLTRL